MKSTTSTLGILFDLDGTLIDSVYQHVLAWHQALREEGIDLSVWRIHRRIGMSGGLFVDALARETGVALDAARGDRLRRRHAEELLQRLGEIRPLPGATQLLSALDEAGVPYALATSGRRETADFTLPLLQLLQSVVDCCQVHVLNPEPVERPMYWPTAHAGLHMLPAPCRYMSALPSPSKSAKRILY